MTEWVKAPDEGALLSWFAVITIGMGIALSPESSVALSGGFVLLGLLSTLGFVAVRADGAIDVTSLDDVLAVFQYAALLSCILLFSYPMPSRLTEQRPVPWELFGWLLAAGVTVAPVRYVVDRTLFRRP